MRNEKLIEARKQRGWTQERAAEEIGVSRAAYARWEEKGVIPHISTMKLAFDAFKMTPEQLGFRKYPTRTSANTSLIPSSVQTVDIATSGGAVDLLRTGILALTLAQRQHNWTLSELLSRIEREMRRLDTMTQSEQGNKLSRRHVINLLMSVPVAALGIQTGSEPLLHNDEILSLCAVNVPLAWRLYFAGGLAEVRQVLPNYIANLSRLTEQSPRYQEQAACLASQAHQLGYLLSLQSQDFSIAQMHVKQATYYAEIAGDSNLQISSLVRQGNLSYTLKRPIQTMQRYQEAIQYTNGASPLIVGQAYIGLAEAHARLGQKQEALRYQGLASDTFPDYPAEDLHFAYTHFNHFTLTNFEGLMFLHLSQAKEAEQSFTKIDKIISKEIIPQRVELLCRQALTFVVLGDLEQSCKYIEQAVLGAKQIGSELRYSEACETYEQMQLKWPNELRVKDLEDLFH